MLPFVSTFSPYLFILFCFVQCNCNDLPFFLCSSSFSTSLSHFSLDLEHPSSRLILSPSVKCNSLSYANSTSFIRYLTLTSHKDHPIFIDPNSQFYVQISSFFLPKTDITLFQTFGLLCFSHIHVDSPSGTLFPLATGIDTSLFPKFSSIVCLHSSSFESLSCPQYTFGPTFVSDGLLSDQTVSGCTFKNITSLKHFTLCTCS